MLKLVMTLLVALVPLGALAETAAPSHTAEIAEVTEWKAVFGKIEPRDSLAARSRLGGTIVKVDVTEGSQVEQGQVIAQVIDEKLTLQLDAVDAMLASLGSQLENAQAELKRGESLLERGVATVQQLDQLRTQVDVLTGQIDKANADRDVLSQRETEGDVLAPISGTVLNVPITEGSVIMPGEVAAQIAGGGFFLRLAVPERHAGFLTEGAEILMGGEGDGTTGTLAKIYPQIENGRVIADVEVDGIATDFVDARVLVRLPVGKRAALVVPQDMVSTRMGLDFVTTLGPEGDALQRSVVLGDQQMIGDVAMVEILSGLSAGTKLVAGHE